MNIKDIIVSRIRRWKDWKADPILLVAWGLAILSAFFVHPDRQYAGYIDWRSLGILWSLMVVIQGLKEQNLRSIAENMGNILERVTCTAYPEIEAIKDKMRECGALNSMMSGSGPTVFGIFDDSKAAKRCYETLRFGEDRRLCKQVYLTEPWR